MAEELKTYCFKLLIDTKNIVRKRAERMQERTSGRLGTTCTLYVGDETVGVMRNVDSWWIEDDEDGAGAR